MGGINAIEALMGGYLRVLHDCDVDTMKNMFLPECNLFRFNEDGTFA